MVMAGLPSLFWPYAVRYWCFADNTEDDRPDGKQAPWVLRHQKGSLKTQHKNIQEIPFGALVFFKPQINADKRYRVKFDPKGRAGIFLGYDLEHAKWKDRYIVADLSDFEGFGTQEEKMEKVTIQKITTIVYNTEIDPVFPLKERYDEICTTLKGIEHNLGPLKWKVFYPDRANQTPETDSRLSAGEDAVQQPIEPEVQLGATSRHPQEPLESPPTADNTADDLRQPIQQPQSLSPCVVRCLLSFIHAYYNFYLLVFIFL